MTSFSLPRFASPQIPGVYREDFFPTTPPSLITGIPIFLGYAAQGPINQLQKLTLWPHFKDQWGLPLEKGYLAQAVHGFFRNGGDQCYILRLDDQQSPTIALRQGLEVITDSDVADLVCAPDIMVAPAQEISQLQQWVLELCDRTNRFAILDTLLMNSRADIPTVLGQRRQLKGNSGAIYGPWVKVAPRVMAPPCGHVAGVYRSCDRNVGVHKAPANVELEDVQDFSCLIDNAAQTALNPPTDVASINCLRKIPGRGLRVWGARTLSFDTQWRYVNVRRFVLTLMQWAEQNMTHVAFEPNDFRLWFRIERELSAYLETWFNRGAFQGDLPQEAFYVKCNGETNPTKVREAGQVITEIGLAPSIPQEFIVVRLIHGNSGITLSNSI